MTRVLMVGHSNGRPGPSDQLAFRLLATGHLITMIRHPLDGYSGRSSKVTVDGHVVCSLSRRGKLAPNLVIDALLNVLLLLRYQGDVTLADTNLDTATVLVVRKVLRRPRGRVVYFAVDYSDRRFDNPVIEQVFRWTEDFCLRHADVVVSNSQRAEAARLGRGLAPARSLVTPNPASVPPPVPRKSIDRGAFIYVGSVTREHGLHELIEVLRPVMRRLVVIGDGPDWARVKALCRDIEIDVELHRHKSHPFVVAQLAKFSGFGLAPYNSSMSWTRYCSPMKVSEYVASGVPVLMSDVPEIAAQVAAEHLGAVYSQDDPTEALRAWRGADLDGFAGRAAAFHEAYRPESVYAPLLVELDRL